MLEQLKAARCEELRAALAGWSPERHAELAELVTQVAQHLTERAPEPPARRSA